MSDYLNDGFDCYDDWSDLTNDTGDFDGGHQKSTSDSDNADDNSDNADDNAEYDYAIDGDNSDNVDENVLEPNIETRDDGYIYAIVQFIVTVFFRIIHHYNISNKAASSILALLSFAFGMLVEPLYTLQHFLLELA